MLIKFWKNQKKIIILYYFLFLLLAEAWVVPHPLQIFRGFGGGGNFPLPPPGYATGKWIHNIDEFCVYTIISL